VNTKGGSKTNATFNLKKERSGGIASKTSQSNNSGVSTSAGSSSIDIISILKKVVDSNRRGMLYCISTGNWCLNNTINNSSKNDGKQSQSTLQQ
jgi:hypothetical protein